jgi:hypothetical protein
MRLVAQVLSVLFHPLLLTTYGTLLLMYINPYAFGGLGLGEHGLLIFQIVLNSFLFPGLAIFLMWRLQLVSTLQMHDKQQRTLPYIATGVFYLWLYVNIRHGNFPLALQVFILGATIGLFVAFFLNIFTKVSMHTVGMGGFVTMLGLVGFYFGYEGAVSLLPLAVLVAGAIGSSRLLLEAHEPADVYGGYLVGGMGQLLALYFLVLRGGS